LLLLVTISVLGILIHRLAPWSGPTSKTTSGPRFCSRKTVAAPFFGGS
jgi:hypothetical protein